MTPLLRDQRIEDRTGADLGACCEPLPDGRTCTGRLVILDADGPIWIVECDQCGYEAGVPARKVNPEINKQRLLSQAGLPSRFIGQPFEQRPETATARDAVRDWLIVYQNKSDRLPAPALWGAQGRGKTHLLTALSEQLIRRYQCRLMFRSMARLLDDLQAGFRDPAANEQLWNRVLTCDVLILDDLGAEQATDWRRDRLARLVDERYEAELPIVIATNFPPSTWEGHLVDARTASRLAGMTVGVELQGPDWRTGGDA